MLVFDCLSVVFFKLHHMTFDVTRQIINDVNLNQLLHCPALDRRLRYENVEHGPVRLLFVPPTLLCVRPTLVFEADA
jgi:hypothetical protein